MPTRRPCVFTVLTGDYERLNEQPIARESEIPFICLTDDPDLRSETWQMQLAPRLFEKDPIRTQREIKIRPYLHLPEYDLSIYIDNSVLLTQPPELIVQRYFPHTGLALSLHSFRDSVLDEFLEVAKQALDDPCRVFEQLNHYTLLHPDILGEHPYWTGILVRDHRVPQLRTMSDIWYANVLRYSRRDQLSVNLALRQAGLTPDIMDIDNRRSHFHAWPITIGREREQSLRSPAETLAVSFTTPVVRIRQLEEELAAVIRTHNELRSSASWRIGQRLSSSAMRHPRLVGSVLRFALRLMRTD